MDKVVENKTIEVNKLCCKVAQRLVNKYHNLSVQECNEKIERLADDYDFNHSEITVIKCYFFKLRNLQGE